MSRFCLSIPKCRSLLKGPPATSTCLSRGSPRWEPVRAPHAPLTPPLQSLKRSSLCPATPAPAPAPPGGPLCSVTQAAFSERPRPESYALLRPPEPRHRPAFTANPQTINRAPPAPLIPPDCSPLSDCNSRHGQRQSGTYCKVSFRQEARESELAAFQKAHHSPGQRQWEE